MSETQKNSPKERLTEIKKLGDTPQAIAKIQELLQEKPRFVRGWIELGLIYRRTGDREAALDTFTTVVELFPKNKNARLQLCSEQLFSDRLDSCRENIARLLEIDPNNANALVRLARVCQKENNYAEADELLQRALELEPTNVIGRIQLAQVLQSRHQYEAAKDVLLQGLVHSPDNFSLLLEIGLLERQQQQKKALDWFLLAIKQAPNLEKQNKARLITIATLRELGLLAEAKQMVEEILQQSPNHIQALVIKGGILQSELNFPAAIAVYQDILASEPEHLKSRLEIAKVYSHTGRVAEAISFLEATCRMMAKVNLQTLIQLGSLHEASENWSSAAYWYQRAYREYPDRDRGYCQQANLYFLQGDLEAALKLLDEARSRIPTSVAIIIKLVALHVRTGNLTLSQQILIDGLDRFPNDAQLLIQLSLVYKKQGNLTAALSTLEQIESDRQILNGRIEGLKADIYYDLYDYERAEQYLRRAINLKPTFIAERNKLAAIYVVRCKVEQARQELKAATAELMRKVPLGKINVPLRGPFARLINELRINPFLLAKLQEAHQKIGQERILELGRLLVLEPNYLGTSLCLARELRSQGIFAEIEQFLRRQSSITPKIPKRIIQFWDEKEPPLEVQRVSQSWIDCNPDYEYTRFSLSTAIAFLEEHYDRHILQAFRSCDQAAAQADFFRLAYLNRFGGFYADMDDMCQKPLDSLIDSGAELIVVQEQIACFGNNFLGCIPHQTAIRTAFYQAANNLSAYQNESIWLNTGPGLITSAICSDLIPYLTYTDYRLWSKTLVLSQAQSRQIVNQHIALSYKQSPKGWQQSAYKRRMKTISV